MKEARLFSLFGELWQDVRFVEFYWVLAGLLAVLGLAWLLTLRLRRRTTPGAATSAPGRGLAAFGAGGLKRVAFPLVALALVVVLRRVLEDLEYHADHSDHLYQDHPWVLGDLDTPEVQDILHLRNLLDLNTADPEQVRKELSFLHSEG